MNLRERILAFLLIIFAAVIVCAQEPPSLGQRIALYSKPAVVRIYALYQGEFFFSDKRLVVSIGGSGSGFFINPDGYIATNAHVVEAIHNGDENARKDLTIEAYKTIGNAVVGDYRRLTTDQSRIIIANLRPGAWRKRNDVLLTNGESMPFEIKAYGAPVGEGKDCAIIKVEVKNAPTLHIGDSERVQLQDHLYALGYPGAADLGSLLDDKSKLEASITDGTVSARKNTSDGAPVLQVTVPIAPGNSGGAAVNEKGEVIGLPTFKSTRAEGFNFLVTSSTLMEFVRQAGTQNTESLTDKYYREGLELFWDRRYTDAIEKFQEVENLFPAHSEVKRLIAESREFKRQGKERFFLSGALLLVGVGGIALLLMLVGGVAIFLLLRSKKPAQQMAMASGQNMPNMMPNIGPAPSSGQLNFPSQPAVQQPMQAPSFDPSAQKTLVIDPKPGIVAPQNATVPIAAMNFGTLSCTRGLLLGQRFDIPAQGITVGREAGVSQIVIPDGRASSKHVWIGLQNGRMVAIDRGSTNGTFINSLQQGRITEAELKDGDVIIIGQPDVCSLTFISRKQEANETIASTTPFASR